MGNKNIRKEVKKKKSTAKPAAAAAPKVFVPQPEIVRKPKKETDKEG